MYLTLVEQALKKLSVEELCALMKDMDLLYCASAFQEDELDGEDLLEVSKEEVVSMLTENGEIANDHHYYLLTVYTVCSCMVSALSCQLFCSDHTHRCPSE